MVPESWKHLPEMVQEGVLMEFLRKGLPRLPDYPQIQEVRKAVQTDIPQRWSFSGGITVVWDGTDDSSDDLPEDETSPEVSTQHRCEECNVLLEVKNPKRPLNVRCPSCKHIMLLEE